MTLRQPLQSTKTCVDVGRHLFTGFSFTGLLAGLLLTASISSSLIAAPPESRTQTGTSEQVETRKPVEVRKSSEASLAKGDITFDDLKFDIEKNAVFEKSLLTKDVKKLNGMKVKLRGYILPSTLFKETDIEQFVLVRDNQECCFGPGAALFDCVIIEMVPGKTTDFVTRPVTVEGKFKIDTEKYKYPGGIGPGGASHFSIFKIAGESVR
ncbi:hypothetical protein CA13_32170 [Planctomycetes bacterium CA13]|uniref:DUF3299 domain-containing protein n=1 Tax=Novipirellula herctigrandis TaxID=2527986 RepID=A0A5C5Z3B0_9BACT|nr:hypothetical protein CA13_32170 [Planctomycetes bacterium CA13]